MRWPRLGLLLGNVIELVET